MIHYSDNSKGKWVEVPAKRLKVVAFSQPVARCNTGKSERVCKKRITMSELLRKGQEREVQKIYPITEVS